MPVAKWMRAKDKQAKAGIAVVTTQQDDMHWYQFGWNRLLGHILIESAQTRMI